ncbi:hypothetical protein [Streptomyces sp. NPDC001781]
MISLHEALRGLQGFDDLLRYAAVTAAWSSVAVRWVGSARSAATS